MNEYYAEILTRRYAAEPTPEARFRAEYEHEPREGEEQPANRRSSAVDIEALVQSNLRRIGHFIRFA
ncbi:MAG TPA: hypothetical protein VFY90_04580 [Tepidiformaceae bacterium]|nr:hypothetical protein [Tepidiformaceae bacterium]HSE46698.1 hypothetical protein [Gemmatimonadales bacterium]